jgi:hypothetical protein
MNFLSRFFQKKKAKKVVGQVITDLDTKPAEDVFQQLETPMTGTMDSESESSVTMEYNLVARKMEDAVEEKKKVRDAAKRLMDAIGVSPELKKSSSQNR